MPYYMIHRDNDGETGVYEVDPKKIKARLGEPGGYDPESFLSELPETADTNTWPGEHSAILLIKGTIVVPKAKKVVERWEIEE
jgi:hypothetical protein